MRLLKQFLVWARCQFIVWRYTRQIGELIAIRDRARFNGKFDSAAATHRKILRAVNAGGTFESSPWMRREILRYDVSTLDRFSIVVLDLERTHIETERLLFVDDTAWRTRQRVGLPTGPLSIEPITES